MRARTTHVFVTILIASTSIGFGLLCKVLHLVPRHEEIVARILGDTYAGPITRGIGVLEVLLGVWVLTGIKKRFTAIVQIGLVGTMNFMEALLAPDLLFFGPLNAMIALVFMFVIYANEWILGKPYDGSS